MRPPEIVLVVNIAVIRGWKTTAGGSGEPREAMEPPTVMVSSTSDRIANEKRKSSYYFRLIFAIDGCSRAHRARERC
jgi:hypothetical protein